MNPLKAAGVISLMLFMMNCGEKKPDDGAPDTVVAKTVAVQPNSSKTILFFGDSLTAGYGLDDQSQAFPGVIKSKIDSLKLPYNVVNAGVSGETSSGGLTRIDWILKQKIDIFILELGANDGLRGISVQETTRNLQTIIDKVRAKDRRTKIILAGMQIPPNMGATYTHDFKALFPVLAAKNHTALIPFLLAGVAGDPRLNQADGIHPTATGDKIVAENVWKVLQKAL